MTSDMDRLDQLKKELFEIKTDFSRRVTELERQIQIFETRQAEPTVAEEPPPLPDHLPVPPPVDEKPSAAAASAPGTEPPPDRPAGTIRGSSGRPAAAPVSDDVRHELGPSMAAGAAEILLPVFGPLTGLVEKLQSVYRHYQEQGKAPAFFMTIAGIVTLVMGFGYLLQYSFTQFLGPVGKVGIGFTAAIAVTLAGILIHFKQKDMADYAASLIGLGVILSYLSAYFTTSFYHLTGNTGAFILLAGITFLGHFLALTFKTRIVAVVSLLGGTLAPLLMAGVDQTTPIYMTYFFILVASTLHISRQINWSILAYIAQIFSMAVIEYILIDFKGLYHTHVTLSVFIHLFFYLFVLYNCMTLYKTDQFSKETVLSISSILAFTLFALNQAVHGDLALGIVYFVNAAVFLCAFFVVPPVARRLRATESAWAKELQMMFSGACGVIAGFAILAIVGHDYLGLAWGVESLLLLYLGLRHRIVPVRIEALGLLMLALVFAVWHAGVWIINALVLPPDLFDLSFGTGWVNLMLTWILIWPAAGILRKKRPVLTPVEKKWIPVFSEALSVFWSLSFLFSAGVVWPPGIWLLSVIPMFGLLTRARVKSLGFTEAFAVSHMLLLVVPMLTSAQAAGSFFFVEQILTGKIARIEAFLCLLLIAEFYSRFYENSRFHATAQVLRILFWCIIPVSFLPGVYHRLIIFFPFAVWISAAVCLALYCRFKYPALLFELKCLSVAAALVTLTACALVEFFDWPGHATLALFSGLLFFCGTLVLFKGLEDDAAVSESHRFFKTSFSLLFKLFFYYLGGFIFILSYSMSGSGALAFTLMTAYLFFITLKQRIFAPLRPHPIPVYLTTTVCIILFCLFYITASAGRFSFNSGISGVVFENGVFNIICLIFLSMVTHLDSPGLASARARTGGDIAHVWMFHLLAGLTYTAVLGRWFSQGFGPALSVVLVVHATLLLFLTLKPRFQKLISLAVIFYILSAGKIILWDMNDFSIIQKVIAFIIIGLLLLGGAYQYQRMRSARQNAVDPVTPETP